MQHDDSHPLFGPLIAWFMVGVAHFGPLEWVQFAAAIAATIYSVVQTVKVLSGRR